MVNFTQAGLALIRNNPALLLPTTDRQATDIALFLLLWMGSGLDGVGVASWLDEMARRLSFTIRTRGRYPSSSSDYRDLAEHPRDRSDGYFEESTSGSTLIPLIMAWLHAFGRSTSVQMLVDLAQEKLPHTTMQLWMPDETSEAEIYVGGSDHGRAITELPVQDGGEPLLKTIAEACHAHGLESLTPMITGFWSVLLVACRHRQLPVPPHLWIEAVTPAASNDAVEDPPAEERESQS